MVENFLDVSSTVLLVDCKEGVDDLADNRGAGTLPSAALVIADDRRRDVKPLGQEAGSDLEVHPPLLQGVSR
jgi:hypothetical protein